MATQSPRLKVQKRAPSPNIRKGPPKVRGQKAPATPAAAPASEDEHVLLRRSDHLIYQAREFLETILFARSLLGVRSSRRQEGFHWQVKHIPGAPAQNSTPSAWMRPLKLSLTSSEAAEPRIRNVSICSPA